MTRSVGVKAVFDVTDFEKGLNAYITGLNSAINATSGFADKINAAMNQAASGVKSTLDAVSKDLNSFATKAEKAASRVASVRATTTQATPATPQAQATPTAIQRYVPAAIQRVEPPTIRVPEFRPERLLGTNQIGPIIDAQFKVVEQKLLTYNQSFSDIIQGMIQRLGQSANGIGGVFSGIGTRITGGIGSAVSAVRGAFSSLTSATQQGSTQTTNQVRNIGPAIGQAFGGIGGAINTSVTNTVGVIQRGLGGIANAFGSFRQSILSAAGTSESQLSAFATGFVQGLGQEAVRLIQSFARELRGLAAEGLQIVTFFERLGFAIETNMAQQLRKASGYTLDMASALEQARVPAHGFVSEVQKLAVLSPFNTRDVAAVVNMGNQYGFTTEQILRQVQALLDLGAARGLDGQQLVSTERALGQIFSKRKLYQQELNQLGEAGIPIYDALAEELGITAEQIAKAQQANEPVAGAIEAIDALLRYSEENFKGTALRAATTLGGLVSTLQDIRELVSKEIFGGFFAPIQPIFQELVAFTTNPDFLPTLRVIGETIGTVIAGGIQALRNAIGGLVGAYQALSPQQKELLFVFLGTGAAVTAVIAAISAFALAIAALTNPVTVVATAVAALFTAWYSNFQGIQSTTLNVLGTIGSALQRLADEAVYWGSNIVQSLSDGIVGAVGAVFDALSVIGGAITGLLQPGSPPKLLPDLDKWGTEAAEVYLQGWTQADFGALDKIAGYFNSFFNSLAGQGAVKQTDVPKLTIKVKEAVAQAIAEFKKFGAINEETLAKIAKLGGPIGNVLTTYVQRYVQLTTVTNQVAAAQEKLNSITQRYDRILRPLQLQLAKIQDIRQTQSEDKRIRELQNVLTSRYASEIRKRNAQLELQEILLQQQIRKTTLNRDEETAPVQEQLSLSQQQQQTLQNELGLFESKIGQQQEYNQLLAQSIQKLTEGFAGVGKAIKEGLSELEKQLKAIQFQREALRDHVRAAELRYLIEQDSTTEAQKKAYQLELQELTLRRQQRIIEATKLGITLPDFSNIPVTMDDFSRKVRGADKDIANLGGTLEGIKNLDLTKSVNDFNKSLDKAREKFDLLGGSIQVTLQKINDSLPGFLQFLGDSGKLDTTSRGVQNLGAAFKGLGVGLVTFFSTKTILNLAASLLGLRGKLALLATGAGLLAVAWEANWLNIQGVTQAAKEKIDQILAGGFKLELPDLKLKEIGTWVFDSLDKKVKSLTNGVAGLDSVISILGLTVARKSGLVALGFSLNLVRTYAVRLGASIGLLRGVLGGLILLVTRGGLVAGLRALGLGLLRLATSTNVILLVTSIATQALVENWWGVTDGVSNAISGLLTSLDKLLSTDKFTKFGQGVVAYFTGLGAPILAFKDTLSAVGRVLLDFFSGKATSADLAKTFGAITEQLFALIDVIVGPFKGAWDFLKNSFFAIKDFLTFDSVGDFVGKIFIELPSLLISGYLRLWGYVVSLLPNLLGAGIQVIGSAIGETIYAAFAVAGGVVTAIRLFILGIAAIFSEEARKNLFTAIREVFGRSGSFIAEIQESLSLAGINIGVASNQAWTQVKSAWLSSWERVFKPALAQLGSDIANGLFDGIQAVVDGVGWERMSQATATMLGYLKQALGISSPSRVMMDEIGAPAGQGILDGIREFVNTYAPTTVAIVADAIITGLEQYLGVDKTKETIGKPTGEGVLSGIQQYVVDFAADTAIAIKDELLKRFWSALGIASPSTVFKTEVGEPIGQGILAGISEWITTKYQVVVDAVVGLKDLIFSTENIAAFGTAALDLGKSILQGIMDGISSLYQKAKELFDNTVGNLISGAKELLGLGGQEAASGVTEGLSQGLAALDRDELVGVFAEAIIAAFEQMKGNVVGTFTTLSADVQTALTTLQTNATTLVTTLTQDISLAFLTMGLEIVADTDLTTATLLERYTAFKESLVGDEGIVNQITATTVQFFTDMGVTVVEAVNSMVANILAAFTGDEGLLAKLRTDFVDAGESLGRDFIDGIEKGISEHLDQIRRAAEQVADEAVSAAQESLEAASPSKRAAREIGEPFAQGIGKGILSGLGLLTQNTGSVIESLFGITSAIESRLGTSPAGSVVTSNSNRTNNFNLNVNSALPSSGIVSDFGIMQTLAGAA